MKKLFLITSLFLTGCTTTVYVPQMPEVPESLKKECKPLSVIAENATTAEAVETIADNYSKYHECSDKVDNWIDWYTKQKEKIGNSDRIKID